MRASRLVFGLASYWLRNWRECFSQSESLVTQIQGIGCTKNASCELDFWELRDANLESENISNSSKDNILK